MLQDLLQTSEIVTVGEARGKARLKLHRVLENYFNDSFFLKGVYILITVVQ